MTTALYSIIGSFISGSGIMYAINWRLNKRSKKISTDLEEIEYARKVISFYNEQGVDLMKRVSVLENDVRSLSKLKCEKIDCKNRVPQQTFGN